MPVVPRTDGVLEVSVREVIQTRYGETVGLIVGVWRDGFFQGTYFEQVRTIPQVEATYCRNTGINSRYSRLLNW